MLVLFINPFKALEFKHLQTFYLYTRWSSKGVLQFKPCYENQVYLAHYAKHKTLTHQCNTPGVYHQLSNEFKLNHGMLSGDGDVKVKPMGMSPNLNSDIAPLLYI